MHGLATYGYSWSWNIDELKKDYRCIAIDLPGNGYSEGGDYPYGINFYSGCIYDFIQKLQLRNLVLVGHSMGGQICINLVANQPDACKKLVLCAPAGFETFNPIESTMYKSSISFVDFFSSDENSLRKTIKTSFYNFPERIEEMISELVIIMKQQSSSRYRKMIDACVNSMLDEPVFQKLILIQQPTLVLFGERDALIPNRLIHPTHTEEIAKAGANQIADVQLHIIPKCGHFLQLEKPGEVNRYIKDFVG